MTAGTGLRGSIRRVALRLRLLPMIAFLVASGLTACGSAQVPATTVSGEVVPTATLSGAPRPRIPACRLLAPVASMALALAPDERTEVVRDVPERCSMAQVGDRQRAVTLTVDDPQTPAVWGSSHPGALAAPDVGPGVYAVEVGGRATVVALLPQLTLTLTGAADLDHAKSAIRAMLGL